ncbi:MAG: formylglycine-generating enzyme family protein [Synechocystis sp.]|nr:formylglycine-generating enzyme family protein [Synechocystis sp.]
MATIIKHSEKKEITVYSLELGKDVLLEMVLIPAGEFLMGQTGDEDSYDKSWEMPQHKIIVEKPFLLAQTPITQAQWQVVAGWKSVALDLPAARSNWKGDDLPVERVSWQQAIEFCGRLRQHFKMDFRLPTEAQWEYACRAGTTTPFHCGETISTDLANYNGDYTYGKGIKGENRKKTTPVKQFNPNGWGLYDMHGNVWEWCLDPWHESYQGKSIKNELTWDEERAGNKYELKKENIKKLVNDSRLRVSRGGSWLNYPRNCRSAYRVRSAPDDQYGNDGFRVACRFPRL